MSTNANDLPQNVEKMILEENKLMWVLIALFVGVVSGIIIGYFLFSPHPWHP